MSLRACIGISLLASVLCSNLLGQAETYRLVDPQLKLVPVASDPKESFLGIHIDPSGRLFVGGREGLFVAEPDGAGGYAALQLLLRFPNHAWVYDITTRGNDVYVSTVSAIYLIRDAVTQRSGLKPQRLIWGIPLGHVHQCFHDLEWGPEGDLYFSTGDPLTSYGDFRNRPDHWGHWTWFIQPEGTKVEYNGVGGVFRVHPDGTGLRVVSGGTRNNVGLTFDRHWNLFTNDNDHESLPADYVPGRLLHVTPHTYFAWPRGWMPSKQPHRPDLLETMNDHLGRYVPVGQVAYEDTRLPEKYRHSLIVDRWGEHKLVYCPIEPRGASFKAEEHDLLLCRGDARPVGVAVGAGGRIFVTVCYMAANDSSPTYRSDVLMIDSATGLGEPASNDDKVTELSVDKLYQDLSAPDWSRRHAAHEEIIRRGDAVLAEAPTRLASAGPHDPALESLIWLAAKSGGPQVLSILSGLASTASDNVRLQAVIAMAEFPQLKASDDVFMKAIGDKSPQVQLAGVLALFNREGQIPQAIIAGPARSPDTYLRQAASLLLAQRASLEDLQALLDSKDAATRLAGTIAIGARLTMPPAIGPVPEQLKLDDKAQAGSYVIPNFYDAGPVDLRKLGRIGNYTISGWWKDVPHTADQEQLFALLQQRLADADEQVRYEAAFFLNLLNDPRVAPRIAQVFADAQPKSMGAKQVIADVWAIGPFGDDRKMFELSHAPEDGPINLAARYAGRKGATIDWKRVSHPPGGAFELDKLVGAGPDSSWYAYVRLESAKSQPAVMWVGSQQQVRIWQNGRRIWDNWAGRRFKPDEDRIPITLQAGSNDVLIRVHSGGRATLSAACESAQPIHLTLPDALDSERLAQRLAEAKDARDMVEIPPQFARIDWEKQWQTGNREHGRQLFESLGCSKCHAATNDAPGGGGPSLAEAGKRFTVPYIVESILLPNKVVSPLFRWTVLQLNDGQVFNGLVVDETAERIDMRMQDTTLKTFNKADVKARRQEDRSPMPQGLVRTPEELRDVLAFLMST